MKFTLITLLTVLTTAVYAEKPPVCPMGEGWVFDTKYSDEFNGDKLDVAKWWDFNPEWHGRKPGYFSRDNVAVKDGMLQLTARAMKPEEVSVENKVRGYDKFTTSIIKSKKRVKYGYFEARAKSMHASVCNAFWLYDPLNPSRKYKEGSYSEEIDIFEVFGKPTKKEYERVYCTTVHRFKTPYYESIIKNATSLPNQSSKLRVPFDFHTNFHVYGFLWTPKEMVWYLDGKEMFRRDNDYFKTALYVMFDCEIMKGWVGEPKLEDLPATFKVDYFRLWRFEDDEPFPKAEAFK